jgi:hypothetical protein
MGAVSDDLDWDEIPFERAGLLEEYRALRGDARLWRLQEEADAEGVIILCNGLAGWRWDCVYTDEASVTYSGSGIGYETRATALEAWDWERKRKESD